MKIIIRILFCALFFPFILIAEEVDLTLEHAVDYVQRSQGLMHREYLPPNHGMLFWYHPPQKVSIWMYNTQIDLSVAFLDHNMVIREIHELKAYPKVKDPDFFHRRAKTASFEAAYVLEMNKGWFTQHGIKRGDKLALTGSSKEAKIVKQD